MSSDFDRQALVSIFLLEATDGLNKLWQVLHPSDGSFPSPESVGDQYILAHRVRGAASQYGFTGLAEVGATLESILESIQAGRQEDWPGVLDHLRDLVSQMQGHLETIATAEAEECNDDSVALAGSRAEPPEQQSEEQPANQSGALSDDYLIPNLDEEVLSYFGPEAEEYLDDMEAALLRLEKTPQDPETIAQLFRTAHTLKGSAYTVGFEIIGDLTHPVEDLMGAIRDGHLQITAESMDLIFRAVDIIRVLMKRSPSLLPETRSRVASIREELRQMEQLAAGTVLQPTTEVASIPSSTPTLPDGLQATIDVPGTDSLPNSYLLPELDAEVLSYFSPEAQDALTTIESALAGLEKDPQDQESVQLLCQTAETLKRAAYSARFQAIGDITHHVADMMAAVLAGHGYIEPRVTDLLFRTVDTVRLLLRRDPRTLDQTRSSFTAVMPQLRQITQEPPQDVPSEQTGGKPQPEVSRTQSPRPGQEAEPKPTEDASVIRVSQDRLERLLNLVGELVIGRGRLDQRLKMLEQLSEQVMSYRHRMLESVQAFESKHEFTLPSDEPVSGDSPSLTYEAFSEFGNLEFDKYDDFNIFARRMAEVASDVSESMSQLNSSIRQAREDMTHVQHLTTSMRDEVARARMVPIGTPFLRFRRAIREMARATGKEVTLVTSGEQTEVDTAVVERLVDPLIHLVRNAVYHGIEPSAVRIARGKPSIGTVFLNAAHRGNTVTIEVEDDGAGLDLEKIKTRAIHLGLLRPEAAANLSRSDIINLIFLPAFSTADAVGDQAGRGVGMDVVKQTIEGMSGNIEVETARGVGTKFTLELPLTLLISTALLLRVGEQRYAIPLPSVREVILPAPGEIQTLGGRAVLQVWEDTINVEYLAKLLHQTPVSSEEPLPIVIARTPSGPLGLIVDELLGRQEIVIKGLGPLKPLQKSFFGGATIDPEGRVILVLDVARLTTHVHEGTVAVSVRPEVPLLSEPEMGLRQSHQDQRQATASVLLIDDSLSIRKFVGRMLESAGFSVDTAIDGEEGLRKAAEHAYRLIITDLEMPKVNGYEVIQALRNRPHTQTTPIIVMTTRAGEKHRQVALGMGATAYVAKPVEERALVYEVSRLIGSEVVVRR